MSERDPQIRFDQLTREVEQLRAENRRLRTLLALAQQTRTILTSEDQRRGGAAGRRAPVEMDSDAAEKVELLRSLFRGRDDVYALHWESARTGESGYAPAVAGGWRGPKDAQRRYLPLTDRAVEEHLRGRQSIGIYPLLEDDSCWFLACDLDGETWQLDALAVLKAYADMGVPAALERSRSGNGGHVWVFFAAPVPAASARRLGALALRKTMARRAELDLMSYDRLFPNQDLLPARGFGNLIALPLQGTRRAAAMSVFLDPSTLEPAPDQWAFLSRVHRLSAEQLGSLLAEGDEGPVGPAALAGRPTGSSGRVPSEIACTIGRDLAIPKASLPPLLAELKHLASLHNPLFFERQRLRVSTHQTPRLIRCYEENLTHLLPTAGPWLSRGGGSVLRAPPLRVLQRLLGGGRRTRFPNMGCRVR